MAVDGYLLLSGGTDADIRAIVDGAVANGARSPCLVVKDAPFQAFIPIDANSRVQFRQKVRDIIGGRNVKRAPFRVHCPVHPPPGPPPGQHICPIKRGLFAPPVDILAFALVTVPAPPDPDAVKAALDAIHAKGLTTASIVHGSTKAQILVEVQENSASAVDASFAKLALVGGIAFQRLGAHLPGSSGPDVEPD